MSSDPTPTPRLRPRVKVWFEVANPDADGRPFSFGFGLIAILQAVDRAGAIKQAALDLGQSYRHVWGRIKAAEHALGTPLVETRVGGQDAHRSGLTDTARRLIADFLALRARMVDVMEDESAHRDRDTSP